MINLGRPLSVKIIHKRIQMRIVTTIQPNLRAVLTVLTVSPLIFVPLILAHQRPLCPRKRPSRRKPTRKSHLQISQRLLQGKSHLQRIRSHLLQRRSISPMMFLLPKKRPPKNRLLPRSCPRRNCSLYSCLRHKWRQTLNL